MADSSDVGYGRPPVETRFKKGQSGNPRGRPPNSNSVRGITARVLGEKQHLGGQPRGARAWYTTLELLVLKTKRLAASGNVKATELYTRIAERFGPRDVDPLKKIGFLVVPEVLTEEEWEERYSPKDDPPGEYEPDE